MAPRLENYHGINALVTGASSGIGRIFAKRIASLGARVAIVARREDELGQMRVNYFGMMYSTKLLLPQMVAQQKGWIVFTASVAGKLATPQESAYTASRCATTGFAEALPMEVWR